jgi:hypothetical protein
VLMVSTKGRLKDIMRTEPTSIEALDSWRILPSGVRQERPGAVWKVLDLSLAALQSRCGPSTDSRLFPSLPHDQRPTKRANGPNRVLAAKCHPNETCARTDVMSLVTGVDGWKAEMSPRRPGCLSFPKTRCEASALPLAHGLMR